MQSYKKMQSLTEKMYICRSNEAIMKAQVISQKSAQMPFEAKKVIEKDSVKDSIPEGYVSFDTFVEVFDRKLREQYAKL